MSNAGNTPAFQQFLEMLGTHVKLGDFAGYKGGLEALANPNPESYHTHFDSYEIMFHVSTMISSDEEKPQVGRCFVCVAWRYARRFCFHGLTLTLCPRCVERRPRASDSWAATWCLSSSRTATPRIVPRPSSLTFCTP
jgi:hypothetical protein